MKAISIWQPHAHLFGNGKLYETRSWRTHHRGTIAIHAGKNVFELESIVHRRTTMKDNGEWPPTKDGYIKAFYEGVMAWQTRNKKSGFQFKDFPLGAICAIGVLTECVPTDGLRAKLEGNAKYLGDFTDGRFAWRIEHVQRLVTPLPYSGRQGLWTLDSDTEDFLIAAAKEKEK